MFRTMLGGKVHRATVTRADLHYVGSITIDQDLMRAADILEGEQVDVVDITNGARLTTYAINGAAAHLVSPGDLVIIISYRTVDDREIADHTPRVVHVDGRNRIVALGADPAEPVPGAIDQMAG